MLTDMDLPPQPPPDVPAPPPGPEAIRSRRIMRGILWLGGISMVFILGIFITRALIPGHSIPPRTEAVSNIRQIGLNLFAFEEDYGRFPDATTIPAVQARTGTTLALGSGSSNQLFRQLIATGTKSEKIFWAKTSTTRSKPNDVMGADTLLPGDCAFTYIAGLTSTSHPDAPILMTPVAPGTWKFDPKPFKGKAVVFFTDSSATALPIDKNGEVILNGMNLFDPRQPFWGGKPPDIKWPE